MPTARQHPRILAFAGTILLGLLGAAAPAPGADASGAAPKLRVLIYSGLNNHDWRSTTPVLKSMLAGCPRFGPVDVTDDPASVDQAKLARYDVIVSNWTPYPDTRRTWRPETEAAFLDFIRNGGGFVVIHAAACTFQVWPEFQHLIALTWKEHHTSHAAYHTFRVSIAASGHPIARGLTDFYTTDELYQNMVRLTPQPQNVVFKAFSAKDKGGTGKDEPMLVCTEMGRGRGVNLLLGHDAAAMGAGFKTLLLRSAEWAATGQVTIPPPTIWPTTPAAMAAAQIDVDATLAAVARYRYGDERKPLADLAQLVVYATAHQSDANAVQFRQRLVHGMTAILTSKEATPAAKAFVCRQIAVIGAEQQAAALASLLADRELAEPAISALAQIPGPAVGQILRDCLGALKGNPQISAIHALGQRGDCAAAGPLMAILAGSDEASACAAAIALGNIASDEGAEALQKTLASAKGHLRTSVARACVTCADQLLAAKKLEQAAALYARLSGRDEPEQVRMAAFRGTVLANPQKAASVVCEALTSHDPALENMAIQLVPQLPGTTVSEQVASCMGKVSPALQALLVTALAARRDAAAREAVAAAAASPDPSVRLAAIKALAVCGDRSTVTMLVGRIAAGAPSAEAEAARGSLARLRGPGVNEVLAGMLSEQHARAKGDLIRILAARNACDTCAALKKATEDQDAAVRKEAWKALGALAQGPEVGSLVDLLVRAPESQREDAARAVATVLKRQARPDVRAVVARIDSAPTPGSRAALVRIASMIGDDAALAALRKAVRSEDEEVRDAAVRGLAAWPSPGPFEDLVALARDAKAPVHRVLALRGALRLSSKVQGRTPEQMTGLIAELIELAGPTAERKAVLAELGRCPTVAALRLAQKYLANPELAVEAGVAVTQIASALRDTHRDEVLAALRPLVTGQQDPVVVGRACKVLKDILKPVNLAIGATASSPDNLDSDGASGGDQAAIDGNPGTYWDEADGADLYRLRVTFQKPTDVSSINILWHPYEQHQAKNVDVLCDGKVVKQVRGAKCFENEMFIALPPVRCTWVELAIPGKNGLVSPCIHELQVFGQFPPRTAGAQMPQPPKYAWKQDDGALALLNHDRVVWQFNHGANLPKPYFHPVALVDGTILTAPSPADHPWHRALWFSWKMLNGVNYWEEDPRTGKCEGVTDVRATKIAQNADGSARIEMSIDFHPANQPAVLMESRSIDVSAPDARGAYRIDWSGTFTACAKDVLLQGGTAGGGYAGLSVRISQASGDWVLIDSEGRRDTASDGSPSNPLGTAANTHGQRARWMDFSIVDAATAQPCGIAILEHPSNPRHPSQWHNVMVAAGRFGYFSPAMLWSQPYTLAAGQKFTLRYRILVHPGRGARDSLEAQWRAFAAQQ